MYRNSLFKQLTQAVLLLPEGEVLTITDFSDIAKPKTVSKMLQRLEKAGLIRKVLRSIYWRPDGIHSSPEPNEVAKALARENNWNVVPSGETALHVFGVVEETPVVWTYVTNGTYRDYSYDGKQISFSHSKTHFRKKMSAKTKLLVQCLCAYGKGILVNDRTLRKLADKVQSQEWPVLMEETKNATSAWITAAIKKMFKMKTAKETVRVTGEEL